MHLDIPNYSINKIQSEQPFVFSTNFAFSTIRQNPKILDALFAKMENDEEVEAAEEFFVLAINSIFSALNRGEIVSLDPELNPLIKDTEPPTTISHIPYTEMFINKLFENEIFIIPGFSLTEAINPDSTTTVKGACTIFNKLEGTISIFTFNLSQAKHYTDASYVENEFIPSSQMEANTKAHELIAKELTRYAKNIISILTNPSKEIIHVPSTLTIKKKKGTPGPKKFTKDYTLITIGGSLKVYLQAYNHEASKISNSPKSHIVRGHWREFRSERYVHMKGKRIWIYPYIKGMDPNLISQFVHVKKA